jgi:electron transfer flavoprotein alpha subunit
MRRVLVGIKRVIDASARIRVKPDASGVVMDLIKLGLNPFDEIALEEALRLKERGAVDEVIAATVGPRDVQPHLRTALAMGGDRAILITAAQPDADLEPLTIARALLVLIQRLQPLLVLLGKQAIDYESSQVGPMLAALWGRPQATFASKIELRDDLAVVTREVDAGPETLEIQLPALVTADLRLNQPRYVKLPDIMQAKKKPLETIPLDEFDVYKRARGALRPADATPERHPRRQRRRTRHAAPRAGITLMTRVMIIAEHDGSSLNASTARCVTCASQLPDAHITVAVCAADGASLAAQAAALQGVGHVLQIEHAANDHLIAALVAPQLASLAQGYTHLLGPSNTFGKDLMPRLAALLDAPQVSDVMGIESARHFRRPIYAANAMLIVEVEEGATLVATVRLASFAPAPYGGSADVEIVSPGVGLPSHTRFVSASTLKTDRPDLQSAARVVAGGRALGSPEAFRMIYRMADQLGAAVGASRAAVDAGYATNEMQVGQTGKVIAPELYIAVGISGAIQHLTGIKDARTIVAINKDAEAPIFELVDIGLVGDLFQVLPELEELLAAAE